MPKRQSTGTDINHRPIVTRTICVRIQTKDALSWAIPLISKEQVPYLADKTEWERVWMSISVKVSSE